ncbi:MAG TPA: ABC transporter ATP-binding protein, partial [Bdellovibrionales bacterium]|nr:ABC transporter ATP-binding protein [Bdellovibrionales bacterium]
LAQEGLIGARVVKSFAIEDTMIERFKKAGLENVRLNVHLARVQTAFGPLLDFSVSLGLVLLLYVGGESVIGQTLSLGTFVAFQRYIQKLVWPMAALGLAITHYQKSVASSWRLKEIFEEPEEIPQAGPEGRKLHGRILVNDLTFTYPGAAKPSLQNINLVIEPGTRVAFMGPVGSGKTTLLSLFAKLYAVPRGRIYIDGIDINDWSAADLREQIGFVAQDVFLFSESIAENVAFGMVRGREHVESAARLASVHDEIAAFPLGYETKLGERGINVSGGQKQRISIARALVREPPLLILDDALSSVDFHTEERILSGLQSAGFERTQIIAAHRISTVKNADQIFVMKDGKIVQTGGHRQLLSQPGLYRQFYEQQQVQEELDEYLRQIET